jgi:hypothetical protein
MIKLVEFLKNPPPKKITLEEWTERFELVPDEEIARYTYYHNPDWGRYLFPPAIFMVYGTRELKRLKLDNSFASLRMWGFVFNETERLFRAGQEGKKVIATMGDLGIVPVIVQSFPNCVAFYPECIWWTPFFRESTELLDFATKLGLPEAACFSRASLSAFHKRAYFPNPDLVVASTGASCDDYSCVMQQIEDLGYDPVWIEIPMRREPTKYLTQDEYGDADYPLRFEDYLIDEYKTVWNKMTALTGINNINRLKDSIIKANRLRGLVGEIKAMAQNAEVQPLPALELMTLEFGNLYGYADPDEWISIVEMFRDLVRERTERKAGVLGPNAVPVAWITPSADPYLLNLVEDLGGRVVATEYVINQALVPIEEHMDPFRALARAFLQSSLNGSTSARIKRIKEMTGDGRIKGVIITNMLGASHCAMETRLIEKELSSVPVLSIDVPAPFGITEQIRTRIEAFMETIK